MELAIFVYPPTGALSEHVQAFASKLKHDTFHRLSDKDTTGVGSLEPIAKKNHPYFVVAINQLPQSSRKPDLEVRPSVSQRSNTYASGDWARSNRSWKSTTMEAMN